MGQEDLDTLLATCAGVVEVSTREYSVISVLPGHEGFDELAVVTVSRLLADAGISIMYQSTLTTDLLLVPTQKVCVCVCVCV